MELTFDKATGICEFEVTADFNLHLEREDVGTLHFYQRTTPHGEYDYIKNQGYNADDKVIDLDFQALVYPKWIKIKSAVIPTVAMVTFNASTGGGSSEGGGDDMVFFNTSLFAEQDSIQGLIMMTTCSGPINKNTLYATFYTGNRIAASDSAYNQMVFDNEISYIGISNKIVPYLIFAGSGPIAVPEEMQKEMTLYELLEMLSEMGFLFLNESIDSIKSAEVTKDEVMEWLNAQS